MRVLILAGGTSHIADYLEQNGHNTAECFSTDNAELMLERQKADIVLFFDDVTEIPPVDRRGLLKSLIKKTRVVLLAEKTSPLVTYAAGLGVKDFVFLPADPAKILYRVGHPALPEEAANILGGVKIPEDEELSKRKRKKKQEQFQDDDDIPEKEELFSFAKLAERFGKRRADRQLRKKKDDEYKPEETKTLKPEDCGDVKTVCKPTLDVSINVDSLRSTLEKAQKGTRRAGKAVYVYTALSLQVAELALWGVFFVALGLGLVYTAGWVCQEAGWTQGLCKVVISLSQKIAGLSKSL
jgi:DNA-binding response OmpR family regulator